MENDDKGKRADISMTEIALGDLNTHHAKAIISDFDELHELYNIQKVQLGDQEFYVKPIREKVDEQLDFVRSLNNLKVNITTNIKSGLIYFMMIMISIILIYLNIKNRYLIEKMIRIMLRKFKR